MLEDTPQTFLSAVKIEGDENNFSDEMAARLPNVSMVDIREVVKKVTGVMNEMGVALRLMSVFSIVVGFIIVFSLINHQLIERKKDLYLFKMIGTWTKKNKER